MSEESQGGELSLSVAEAARLLGISIATLRRWDQDGRIKARRTAGGHRRFSPDEVQRLLGEAGGGDRHSSFETPGGPLPGLSDAIAENGPLLVEKALRLAYSGQANGWFCSAIGREHASRWLTAVGEAARTGEYGSALSASRKLARVARAAGASMVECDSLLELIRALAGREVSSRAASEASATWNLMVVLRQAALEVYAAQ